MKRVLFAILGILMVASPASAITTVFESPVDGQPVAGIGTVQGWAFSDTPGSTITEVALSVDGNSVGTIPCCSERGDVAAAFPDSANARNSGFGITQNFNLAGAGEHTLTLTITDSSGAQITRSHTVTVAQLGGFEFLDRADLSTASAERQGQDLVLSNVQVRDAFTQEAVMINARLRWFQNQQGLGLVEANITGPASISKSGRPWLAGLQKAATSKASLAPAASVENPGNGDTVSGAALIQGFAFAKTGRSITRVQLFVDGIPSFTIPCCSARADVAGAFSNEPNALNSGFGVTFNYGLLSSGVHQLMIEVEDSEGEIKKIVKGILVKRLGEFEFLEQLDFSSSSVRVANGTIVVERAIAQSIADGSSVSRNLRYRFLPSLQRFQLLEEYVDEVVVTNFGTAINGNIISVTALKINDGGDGISFPEATEAVSNTVEGERILITFAQSGTIQFDPDVPIQMIQRAKVTIDGDGDGVPDVTLRNANATLALVDLIGFVPAIRIMASDVTVRGMNTMSFGFNISPSRFVNGTLNLAKDNVQISNVAILGNELSLNPQTHPNTNMVGVSTSPDSSGEGISNILISNNRIIGSDSSGSSSGLESNRHTCGVFIAGGGSNGVSAITDVTVTENMISGTALGIRFFLSSGQSRSGGEMLSQIAVVNNTVDDTTVGLDVRVIQSLTTDIFDSAPLLEIMIADNIISTTRRGLILGAHALNSIWLSDIRGNDFQNRSSGDGILIQSAGQTVLVDGEGGEEVARASASGNLIETMITDNSITDSSGVGVRILGGSAIDGEATNNAVVGEILQNTIQTLGTGVEVLGGFGEDARGNSVQQDIIRNILNTIQCEDGTIGNRAECILVDNTDASGNPVLQQSLAKQTSVPPAFAKALDTHRGRVASKEQQIRKQADTITDERLSTRLHCLGDRLADLQDRLAARIAGKSAASYNWSRQN